MSLTVFPHFGLFCLIVEDPPTDRDFLGWWHEDLASISRELHARQTEAEPARDTTRSLGEKESSERLAIYSL